MSDLNFLIKAELSDYDKKNEPINGNILIKKDKYKFAGIINYKDNEIKIKKSNFRNIFLDGKLEGKIKLLPYFNFDLDLNLNSLNFTRLYNYFLALDESKQKNLFKINNKINGKLSLSSEKIYSSYNLVKSFIRDVVICFSVLETNCSNELGETCKFSISPKSLNIFLVTLFKD